MTDAVARILKAAEQLSTDERAELVDRLLESIDLGIPPGVETANLNEVRRRVGEVESGKITLIPGGEALALVREIVAIHAASDAPPP